MAFNINNLTPVAGSCKAGVQPVLWMYWNNADDTMTTAGFIKCQTMNLKDQVLVVKGDGSDIAFYYVSAKSGDSITLTANGLTSVEANVGDS